MTDLKHDFKKALAFLTMLYPDGPWALVAIAPDVPPPRNISGQSFTPATVGNLMVWLKEHEGQNIYYHVNQASKPFGMRAGREDITEVCYLHVDVDPRKGEDLVAEQERIHKMVTEPPTDVPRPTFIVKSGGGYNALWRLENPIATGGSVDMAEHAKRYNQQLEFRLGGDNCHNIDRILRCPGTVNWPDEGKRKKGRSPAFAELIHHEATSFALSMFVAAPDVQDKKAGFSNPNRVKISGNIARMSAELTELGSNYSQKLKRIIIEGEDHENPTEHSSRSEALYFVCCELVRGGLSDDNIFAIITDPKFKISASVVDKGARKEKYATRQIERAREHAVAPELEELNQRHAVIANFGGKCRVMQEMDDVTVGRSILTQQSFDDFRNRYMHRKVKMGETADGEPKFAPLGDWWLKNQMRRQFETIQFVPGRDIDGIYNLWRGFACEAIPGDAHEPWLQHVRENICDSNEEYYHYLIHWMARLVQNPATPGEVAVVLRGRMGAGKGVFARTLGALLGRHFLAVSDPKHLVGSFNAHLWDCLLLFADEAFYANDKKHAAKLKELITEETIMIEGKYQNAVSSPNFVHLVMAANDDWIVPAGPDERRFFVLDVSPAKMQDHPYFKFVKDQIFKEGGLSNLLHFLLTTDLTNFEVRKAPKTAALMDQKIRSLTSEEEWWYRKLCAGMIIDGVPWETPLVKGGVTDDYLTYAQKIGIQRRTTETLLGKFLHKICGGQLKTKQGYRDVRRDDGRVEKDRPYYYVFPTLETCRKTWEAAFGQVPWPEADSFDEPPHPNAPSNGSNQGMF